MSFKIPAMTFKCLKHPKYKAKLPPRCLCEVCNLMYETALIMRAWGKLIAKNHD